MAEEIGNTKPLIVEELDLDSLSVEDLKHKEKMILSILKT